MCATPPSTRSGPEDPLKDLDVADAVQQGDDEGIDPEGGAERLGGGLAVVGLDGEEDAVGGAEPGRVVTRAHGPELDVAELASDREAVRAHRREMPAAGDEADLVPGGGKPGAEVPADAPRPHHRELHRPIPCSARNHLRVQRSYAIDQSVPDWNAI